MLSVHHSCRPSGLVYTKFSLPRLSSSAAARKSLFHASHSIRRASTNKTTTGDTSFIKGLFTGHCQTSNVFPYPDVLDNEAKSTLDVLIPPVTKFFEVNTPK